MRRPCLGALARGRVAPAWRCTLPERGLRRKKIEGGGSTAGPRSTARSSRCQYAGDACWCHVDAKVQPRTQGRHVERATPVAAPRFYFKYPSSKMHNFKKSQLTSKSPKIKVVEELYTYNFPKGRHIF
jgi:hypothetical protein